jgi:hypothetical protein
VLTEALAGGAAAKAEAEKTAISAPTSDGVRTLLEYQEFQGVRYYDRACLLQKNGPQHCQ